MPPVRPALGTPAGTGAARATTALRPAASCAGHRPSCPAGGATGPALAQAAPGVPTARRGEFGRRNPPAGRLCVRARSVQPQSHFSSLRFARTANRPGGGFFAPLARRCPSQTVPENAATTFQPPSHGGSETATRLSPATPVRAPVFLVCPLRADLCHSDFTASLQRHGQR